MKEQPFNRLSRLAAVSALSVMAVACSDSSVPEPPATETAVSVSIIEAQPLNQETGAETQALEQQVHPDAAQSGDISAAQHRPEAADAGQQEDSVAQDIEQDLPSAAAAANAPPLPSEGVPPEESPVPSVVDPNVPVLPDEEVAQGQAPRAEPEEFDSAPITNLVPGSPTVVTPPVEDEGLSAGARQTEEPNDDMRGERVTGAANHE